MIISKLLKTHPVIIFIFLLFVHLLLLLKLEFTAWPEMLLWPYLAEHGILPYKNIAVAHTPLLITKLALFFSMFGTGIWQIKIFTWGLIILSDIVLYFAASKLWNKSIAALCLLFYVFMQIFFDGNGLWFETLLVPLTLIFYYFTRVKKYLTAGVIFCIMFFVKQTAVWFLIPLMYEINLNKKLKSKFFVDFIIGATGTLIILLIILAMFNLLPDFFKWAINFGVFILPRSSGQIQMPGLKSLIVSLIPFSMFLPLLFLDKKSSLQLLLLSIAGVLGSWPRFEYFHLQPALPFLAIASGLVVWSKNKINLIKYFLFFYILIVVYLFAAYYLRNYNEGTRFYGEDVIRVSEYIDNNTSDGERIFVLNWWDNIYPLSNTLPVTDPWVPQLAWYQELPGIQDEEVKDFSITQAKFIVYREYDSVGLSSYVPRTIYDFIMLNFTLKEKIGNIQILVPR